MSLGIRESSSRCANADILSKGAAQPVSTKFVFFTQLMLGEPSTSKMKNTLARSDVAHAASLRVFDAFRVNHAYYSLSSR
jgi:hypothetical protein